MTTLDFIRTRDALFRNPTAEQALRLWPFHKIGPPASPHSPLAAVHKARLHWLQATPEMIAESKAWLAAHGFEEDIG